MPYKDPEQQRAFQREYQRERRASLSGTTKSNKTLNREDTQTARGLLELLSTVIAEVRTADGDIFLKARLTTYIVSVTLKCVETADLESRITDLENSLLQDKRA